ncbi:MAG TPA: cyclic nucleotide-binding domain-containing protein, partial [Acidimicrobiales bacterium]|nr:cyclic nucleotide-binding domain-containing protein [Acidimicrobiales bacterium]
MSSDDVSPTGAPSDELGDVGSPTLSPATLTELAPFGREREVVVGENLFRAGDASYDFVVVLEGEVEVVRPDDTGDVLIVTHGPGRFIGELSLVTGERPYLTARV